MARQLAVCIRAQQAQYGPGTRVTVAFAENGSPGQVPAIAASCAPPAGGDPHGNQVAAGLTQALRPGALTLRLTTGPPVPPAALGGAVPGSGYSSGGAPPVRCPPAVSPGLSPSLPPGTGFGRAGRLGLTEDPAEPDLVLGAVTGYRWWTLAAPDFNGDPARADETWPRDLLRGQYDAWQPGVNAAECKVAGPPRRHYPETVPDEACGCGFWAYWLPQWHKLSEVRTVAVFGVVKGSGKVLIGEQGFRAARARPLAVHLPFTLAVRATAYQRRPEPDLARALRKAGFTGAVHTYRGGAGPGELELTYRDVTAAQDPEGHALAEAWMAVLGDRLAQVYPGVDVCETRDLLLAKYPPDPNYARQALQCGNCGQAYLPGTAASHALHCLRTLRSCP